MGKTEIVWNEVSIDNQSAISGVTSEIVDFDKYGYQMVLAASDGQVTVIYEGGNGKDQG